MVIYYCFQEDLEVPFERFNVSSCSAKWILEDVYKYIAISALIFRSHVIFIRRLRTKDFVSTAAISHLETWIRISSFFNKLKDTNTSYLFGVSSSQSNSLVFPCENIRTSWQPSRTFLLSKHNIIPQVIRLYLNDYTLWFVSNRRR